MEINPSIYSTYELMISEMKMNALQST